MGRTAFSPGEDPPWPTRDCAWWCEVWNFCAESSTWRLLYTSLRLVYPHPILMAPISFDPRTVLIPGSEIRFLRMFSGLRSHDVTHPPVGGLWRSDFACHFTFSAPGAAFQKSFLFLFVLVQRPDGGDPCVCLCGQDVSLFHRLGRFHSRLNAKLSTACRTKSSKSREGANELLAP